MDRELIIRLAEEAGLEPRLWNHTDAFERFAALVAAHEREECAKLCGEAVWSTELTWAEKHRAANLAETIRNRSN